MAFSSLVEDRGKALWTLSTLLNWGGGKFSMLSHDIIFSFSKFPGLLKGDIVKS